MSHILWYLSNWSQCTELLKIHTHFSLKRMTSVVLLLSTNSLQEELILHNSSIVENTFLYIPMYITWYSVAEIYGLIWTKNNGIWLSLLCSSANRTIPSISSRVLPVWCKQYCLAFISQTHTSGSGDTGSESICSSNVDWHNHQESWRLYARLYVLLFCHKLWCDFRRCAQQQYYAWQ